MTSLLTLAPLAALPMQEPVDLNAGSTEIHHYDCAPELELDGPEIARWIELDTPGLLRVEIDDASSALPWLLLLREPSVEQGRATGCLAHDQGALLQTELAAGRYLLVVEAVEPPPEAALQLAAESLPADTWTHRELAPGVRWERRWSPTGPQTVNLLRVAPSARALLHPRRHDRCTTVPEAGEQLGALAGINVGFFSKRCEPLCLLVDGGETLATNAMRKGPQRSLGWSENSEARWAWVDEGLPWRGVDYAVAGFPSLVREGEALVDPPLSNSFATARHPRSAIGVTADGTTLLVTVDGRTTMGAGATLTELAALLVELGAEDAINLDGGGSTTMWIDGAWLNGVANHPSDNLQGDHHGARAVSDGLYVLPSSSPSSSSSTTSTFTAGLGSENKAR